MSRRSSALKATARNNQTDDPSAQQLEPNSENRFDSDGVSQWRKALIKRFVVEQTMSHTAVLALHFCFFFVQVLPTLYKEMLHTGAGYDWRSALKTMRANHGAGMAVLAAVLLFKLIF